MPTMHLLRIPTEADIERDCDGMELDSFTQAFNKNSAGGFSARVNVSANGIINLGGWEFRNNASADWYTIRL